MKMLTIEVTLLVDDDTKQEDIDADVSNAITQYEEADLMSPGVEWFETNATISRPYAEES